MDQAEFHCKPFSELTSLELYDILQLRSAVFVVEQNCVYQDVDGFDLDAHHVYAQVAGQVVAYARLIAPGIKYPEASLGRVVSRGSVRGSGLGKQLMTTALRYCDELWPAMGVTISAQAYLEKFYQQLGFTTRTEPYLEDDIPHIKMNRQ
ncbi:MAG: ElaA protein [Pseudohongiellaceae bacterium]|jgi:ElaA protein